MIPSLLIVVVDFVDIVVWGSVKVHPTSTAGADWWLYDAVHQLRHGLTRGSWGLTGSGTLSFVMRRFRVTSFDDVLDNVHGVVVCSREAVEL